jgi:hypothetical protein
MSENGCNTSPTVKFYCRQKRCNKYTGLHTSSVNQAAFKVTRICLDFEECQA